MLVKIIKGQEQARDRELPPASQSYHGAYQYRSCYF